MRVAAAIALGVSLLAAGCGGSSEATPVTPPPSPFAYDASRPLGFRDAGRVNHDYPIAIRDVSFLSGGRRIQGYLAVPPGNRRRPAAVYVHGSGGDRRQLLVHAVWLAGRGAVTLAITAPSASTPAESGVSPLATLERQRELTVADVVAVRRAFDLLRSRRDVDGSRLGYVGWSAGARTGALLAGVEHRARAFVLMSGGATPVSVYAATAPPQLRGEVKRLLSDIDPLQTIRRARPRTLLLQDGRRDTVVPRDALQGLAEAAPKGTDVRWYPAGHDLDNAAFRDQLDWLERRLGLQGAAIPGAVTGP